MSVFLKLPK